MNLPKITPKDMAFTVLSEQKTNKIFEGMIIDYMVSPLFGIPLKWKTRITEVIRIKFTDFQEKGPQIMEPSPRIYTQRKRCVHDR
jgi:ligand-binding SRPBCC domain-containing protein